MNLIHVLAKWATENPHQEALVEGGRHREALTYRELDQCTKRGAGNLKAAGIGKGDAVLFAQPVSIDLYVALLSVFRVGAVAVIVDPSAGLPVYDSAVERLKPKGFFGSAKGHMLRLLRAKVREIPVRFTTDARVPATRWLSINEFEEGIADVTAEDPALVTFTSGSTGQPKAVVRSHGFLQAQYETLSRSLGYAEGQVDLVTLPVFALANLAAGVKSVIAATNLAKPGEAANPQLAKQLEQEGITRMAASPAFYQSLLSYGASLEGLRQIYTGGAPVFPPLLDALGRAAPEAEVVAVYGSTEAEPIAHLAREEISDTDLEAMAHGNGLLAGKPVPDIELMLLPNTWGRPIAPIDEAELSFIRLGAEAPGEIMVSGDHVLKGYLDGVGDEETKFRVGDRTWHRTGDAGKLDARGRLWLLGRAGAVIQDSKGALYPFALETAMTLRPGIARAAVLAHKGKRVLVVEAESGEGAGLRDSLKDILRSYYIDVLYSDLKIPLDVRHNAKVDYPKLTHLVAQKWDSEH